ncbi:glycoside hydrolase family 9 protein [Anaerorhabdus sp.]|uniref:glycoside hydrolase family 9 protein n=1 Tax=Anaerorhabdus sp. TaxID=1872524 RepID=UPI002B218134|nr:glycoside hydrolase family 9 protein [Anaerorhabdus sp.]MEA4875896.1 glycoside hydrolase family 9 protein [Anaerorhabdus sp.]
MKKLLTCLLLFIILGILLNMTGLLGSKPIDENNQPTSTPTIVVDKPDVSNDSYIPITVDNETNFVTSWYTQGTDANVQSTATFDKQDVKVTYPGTTIASAQLFRDGIPLLKGSSYVLTADVNSTVNRDIEISFGDADTGEVYATDRITINGYTSVRFEFKMNSADKWNGRISFNLGNDGTANTSAEHTITVSNIRIRNGTKNDNTIKVNQIGYTIGNDKKCVFPYNQGDLFDVVNVKTNEIVYTGAIVNGVKNEKTGETNFTGNFTNVITPGTYRVEAQITGTSFEFTIGDDLYHSLSNDLLKFFSFQRCAYALDPAWAFDLAHIACHDTAAIVYDDPTRVIDVNGGWHDAGDYGRYVKTGTKAVNDLMLAYIANPSFFKDDAGIPETGNGIPDILDEARFELEWLMKMQADWGGVYNKAVTQGFPGDISPDEDMQRIYVLPAESTTTAGFISTMAIASIAYKDVDPTFAAACLEKTKKSWENLVNTPDFIEFTNPTDFTAGEYRDDKDSDERYFAGMAMWYATGDAQYLEYAKENYTKDNSATKGTSWSDVGAYGSYLFLMNSDAKKQGTFYETIKNEFKTQADILLGIINADGYQTSLENYSWGSNGYAANNGIQLMFAYDIFGDISYKQGAIEQANYILGKNSLNMSFVSGYGKNSPVNMHHRLAKSKNAFLKGALVGGPDNDREDTITAQLGANVPPAKVYVDQYLSYSSNEVTIYWNSALIYVLSRIN